MKNFRTFNLAVNFAKDCRQLSISRQLRDQLLRASQSIVLNLAEGRGKPTVKDQKRFFAIAFGSVRECQAILILEELQQAEIAQRLDTLAAHLYKLMQAM